MVLNSGHFDHHFEVIHLMFHTLKHIVVGETLSAPLFPPSPPIAMLPSSYFLVFTKKCIFFNNSRQQIVFRYSGDFLKN